jgi:hypothetical protein
LGIFSQHRLAQFKDRIDESTVGGSGRPPSRYSEQIVISANARVVYYRGARAKGQAKRVTKQVSRRGTWMAMRSITVLIALFALSMRLTWPAPPIPFVATGPVDFGAHALCLAGSNDEQRQPGNDGPADHADHDGLGCCLFHGASATAPPPVLTAGIAFAAIALPPPADQPYRAPAYPPGASPARAPPHAT